MANAFYNVTGSPVTGSSGASAVIRSEYAAIASGFDKMPALTAGTAIIVNGAGTALTNTVGTLALAGNFATTGAFATTLAQSANVTLTLPGASDTLVGRATTDTLTNKTLTAPVIATIVNTGTLTLPTSTDTLVGRATTDTLTNKTLTAPTINGGTHTAITSLGIRSTGAAFDLTLATAEVLTAGRTLSVVVGDSARTLTLTGSPSLSGATITGTGTLATTTGKTATFSNSLTFAGTDSTTMTFPSTSATIARTDAANTFIGHQTIEGVTSTGATGTGKFVFDTSPTLSNPVVGTQAAGDGSTKAASTAYADTAAKTAAKTVDYVSTSNVDISTALANGQTLDGGTLATGQRVLLTAQSTGSQNGIYDVPASGAASRSADSNSATLMPSGITVAVTRGTLGAGSTWLHTTAPGFTVGTTALSFSRIASATRNVSTLSAQSPTGTASTTLKQMGLGSSLVLTPRTGKVRLTLYGWLSCTSTANMVTAVSYGTGTAPVNGAAQTGTLLLPGLAVSAPSGYKAAIAYDHEISGLTIGTPYWFDINLDTDAGTASLVVGQVRVEDVQT